MSTRSISGSLTSACQSPVARVKPRPEAARSARLWSASATVWRTGLTGRPKTAGAIRQAKAWLRPMKPEPIRPTLSRRMALPREHLGVDDRGGIEPALEPRQRVPDRLLAHPHHRLGGRPGDVRREQAALEAEQRVVGRGRLRLEHVEAGGPDPALAQDLGQRRLVD